MVQSFDSRIMQVTLVVHAALLLWDKMPWFPIMVSAAAHVLYLQASHTERQMVSCPWLVHCQQSLI
jgi:hypothetical protein